MSKKCRILFIVILLNLNFLDVFADDDKPDEEYQPNYEYVHIFKSIPSLFEYLLNALEERPEILEKSDIKVFKRNSDTANDENETTDESKTEKRDVDYDNDKQDKLEENNEIDKRDAETTRELTKTAEAYEYGNSNVVMKDYSAPIKRFASKILPKDLQPSKDEVKRDLKFKKINNLRKRSVLLKLSDDDDEFVGHENAFYGFDNFFDLDLNPEDIEERILTAEKLLEEHNSQKENDK